MSDPVSREKTSDDYRRFLGDVLAALGWDQPEAIEIKTEAHALAEIRRLRTVDVEHSRKPSTTK